MKTFLDFYKRLGLNVIPIAPPTNGFHDGKKPSIPGWKAYIDRKSSDFERDQWFSTPSNIAVITGTISDVIVVDIDDELSYHEIIKHSEVLKNTLTVKTGKGYHIYLRPDVHRNTHTFNLNNKLHHIKDERSYVIAPPSRHISGRSYEFYITTSPQEFKYEHLEEILTKAGAVFKQEISRERPATWASDLVDICPEGERNNRAIQLCGLLIRKFPQDPNFVKGMMMAWNDFYCRPPLGNPEINHLIESALRRYGDGHSRI